jgi:hypothetical protein
MKRLLAPLLLSVWLAVPALAARVVGPVPFSATPLDGASDANIAKVDFLIDGVVRGTDTDPAGGWGVTIDTDALARGDHTWAAKAYDKAGNSATSAETRTFRANTPPHSRLPPTRTRRRRSP